MPVLGFGPNHLPLKIRIRLPLITELGLLILGMGMRVPKRRSCSVLELQIIMSNTMCAMGLVCMAKPYILCP